MNNNTTAIILCAIIAVAFISVVVISYNIYQYNNELKSTVYSNFKEHCRNIKTNCDAAVNAINEGDNANALLHADTVFELMSSYHYEGIELLGSDYLRLYAVLYSSLPQLHNDMLAIHTALLNSTVSQDQINLMTDCGSTFFYIFQNTPEPDWSGYRITSIDYIIIELGKLTS